LFARGSWSETRRVITILHKETVGGALLLCAGTLAQAQGGPTSPAKKEVVQKLLTLQQPGIESAARGIVSMTLACAARAAGGSPATLQSSQTVRSAM
jgi:hypothetical protein